ncbi:hypothetical protein BRO54_2066 [Geobacillus proteiniphilus]|uniref:Uncharacterized protein n=1 Tax=Geobacillus proteiniphilus TaxID=860353 RepID=A0A1Q5SYZ9_9BACL|nr:hypothetical protein BRO54_2066 [Geobacillus proteiniphilus]
MPFRCSEPVSERRFLLTLRLMMGMAIAAWRMMPAGLNPICISYRCNLKLYHLQLLPSI